MNVSLTGKNILVTGGAGFIGSNLCEALIDLECNVICLDNFSTGKKENILPFLNNNNFKLIEGDIRNIEDCMIATKNIDFVLHQAALGSVPRSIKNPRVTNDVNASGFVNMMVASKENKVKRFVYATSSSVYGDSKILPKTEDIIGKPMSPYAVTKHANELYANVFAYNYGIETIGLRYFNVFGRRQDPKGEYSAVIPKFIDKLMKGESPIIYGDGKTTRDFTHIDNVIYANILSLTTSNKNAVNQVFNIAGGGRDTLLDLVNYLKKFLSEYGYNTINIKIEYQDFRLGDIAHSYANIDKAKKILNYTPKYTFQEGLKKAIKWYKENL